MPGQSVDPLRHFSPRTASWFRETFGEPTEAQAGAWDAIAAGSHTLVVAPTGSGKTLSAFLHAIDQLVEAKSGDEAPDERPGTRILYVSPLKALAVDIERNLTVPLAGIAGDGDAPEIRVGVRTGDTTPQERRRQRTHPPDILVTTPESLFLLLTSAARDTLRSVSTVIVDEIHALTPTKRGAHLGLSIERLDALTDEPLQRVGLSATVRPYEEAATFLAGERPVEIVAPPATKILDLSVRVPVEDMTELSTLEPEVHTPAGLPGQGSIWPHVERQIVDLVTEHRSTIVFVNSRRLAERLTARLNEIHAEDCDGEGAPAAPVAPARPPAQVMASSEQSLGAPTDLAMAHHGSVSKDRRAHIEWSLKTGRLRAVVATSSLELGIDMGDVDLVIQVDSPPSVGSGLQRVGRAGHRVGEVSRAVVVPTHRADLVPAAVTLWRMGERRIEETRMISHPLDVLAQHVVSAGALDRVDVEEFYALVRRSGSYLSLPRDLFDATLDMVAGRYPSADFADLRPRIVWDRAAGTFRGRPGAQRLAVTSGGTIPDRGNFGVFLVGEQRSRVGELDEEMVYESRVGDVFALGASSWRIEEISHDRVLVSPAPGGAGRLPFWRGDDLGRPAELGRAVGAFLDELGEVRSDGEVARLVASGLDVNAARNLLDYVREQREATRVLPGASRLVVERFADEVGDWRVVLHSPFGTGVHLPWAVAIRARVLDEYGIDPEPVANDDGIILRLPDMIGPDGRSALPGPELFALEPEEARRLVTSHVGESSLFASRFRECAARSLLLPRLDPGRRSPLWQQRLKSSQLLDVARRYPDFPVILEAVRECLQDVYDMSSLMDLLGDIGRGEVAIEEVETPSASPFARAMMFRYVGEFVYNPDAPLAEKRAAALSIDTGLLGQLLGEVSLRELLDRDVVETEHARRQHLTGERAISDAEGLVDLLRTLGPLTHEEIRRRVSGAPAAVGEWLNELTASTRVVDCEWGGETWWCVVEDMGRLRDALGVAVPDHVPEEFTGSGGAGGGADPAADPLGELVRRFARTRGPFTLDEVASRFGLGTAVARRCLDRLSVEGAIVAGEFTPDTEGAEWCDAGVLAAIRRASLQKLRGEIEPVAPEALGRFAPTWHGVGGGSGVGDGAARGIDGLLDVVDQLDGLALPAAELESQILASRIRDYRPAMLDEMLASGDVLWCGRGRSRSGSGTGDGWISLHLAESAPLTLPTTELPNSTQSTDAQQPTTSPLHARIRDALADGGRFFRDIADAVGESARGSAEEGAPVTEADIRSGLWDLVWAGVVTNDTLSPLRAALSAGRQSGGGRRAPSARRGRRRGGRGRASAAAMRYGGASGSAGVSGGVGMPGRVGPSPVAADVAGRWSLLPARESDPTLRAHAWAEVLLGRHGVVTRGAVENERVPGGFAAVYKVLSTWEDSGGCRRGYFVDGLGAAQFPAGSTIDALRGSGRGGAVVLAAADPANPYGAALSWPSGVEGVGHRPGRKAGAVVVLVDGDLALFVERGGRRVLTFPGADVAAAAEALAEWVGSGASGDSGMTIEAIDDVPAVRSGEADAFRGAGFAPVPKGLRLRRL